MGRIRYSRRTFFSRWLPSPKLRIRLAAVLWAVSLGATGCDKLGLGGDDGPTAPSGPPPPGTTIRYTPVGASDVSGYGSSVPCFPYVPVCLNGTGYAFVAARQLRSQNYTVIVTNNGMPTAVISRGFQELGQQYGKDILGNFIEHQMPFIPAESTLVTIFAGANDVNVITAALGGGAGSGDRTAYIDERVRNFGNDYATLLTGVRAVASSARVIVLNLPNIAGMPFRTRSPLPERQAAQRASVRMTTTVINTLRNVTVIDLMCDARMYQPSIYSSDGFHPNDSGYAIIADEIVKALTLSSYPAPKSSCAQMTLVP
jgi:lysophospholipase L1-like esterase